ncbi:MAG: effector binding domain-containing protein [Syntrophomonas sp.]
MEIHIMERETFFICGYSVETTLAQNDNDVSALYDDFFRNGKEAILMNLNDSKKGYYGLSWYTQDHERYCYLLGLEVGQENAAPENTVLKKVPKTAYAVACFPQGEDIIKAWTEFFYNEIPKAGFKVNEEHNLYFEYYPRSVQGEFELWVPVVKVDV